MPGPEQEVTVSNALAISDQLKRILASKTFRRLPRPKELLSLLVDMEIAGTPLDERAIGVRMFNRKPDWIMLDDNIVRQNTSRLRKLLQSYYASEGIDDRLNIEIVGMRAVISLNTRNPAESAMRRIRQYLSTDHEAAIRLLNDLLTHEVVGAEAQAAWGETEFWSWFTGWDLDREIRLEHYEHFARESLKADPASWRGHVLMGALHCSRWEWSEAGEFFDEALKSSPTDTKAHVWYAAYLMAIGKYEEALQLTEARTNNPSDSPYPHFCHALFLYVAREYDDSWLALQEAQRIHPGHWLYHLLTYILLIAQNPGKSRDVLVHLGAYSEIVPPKSLKAYPVLEIVCYTHILEPDYPEYELVKGGIEDYARAKLASARRLAPGEQGHTTANRLLSPFQLAIGYMTIGDLEQAAELLAKDCERKHPMMAWLHLWPIFDELRMLPSFQNLIVRMNLPQKPGASGKASG